MKRTLAVWFFVLLSGCAASHPELPTQQGVDLQKYAGTWYEQARLPNRFQDDCVGDVRADYALQTDESLSVTNQCRTKDGSIVVAEGEGRLSKSAAPRDQAKLEVRFAPEWTSWLPMVWGDYWILRLDGDYQYSLVGTPDRKYLWVLSRDQQADEAAVEALLDYANTLGFPVDQITRSGK
ncbi:lipocalin family protein [Pusillimonas sp.]|uniref:lipocalin family protein n=1 Tax=Pusillimonas sp. TaxID=3040095 RepID=UPI0029B7BB1D|nr:lipocalin family protein [Pusillimonas sp.]MDX3895993.1 lipocalin family protein [Pusillimonas sp.]